MELSKRNTLGNIHTIAQIISLKKGPVNLITTNLSDTFVPDDLSAPRPLLIALHGGGRDSASQIKLWRPLAEKEKLIVLAPNSLRPSFIEATWFTPNDTPSL